MELERRRAWIALGLLVPAPTLGALAAFVVAPGPIGQAVYALCKLWILVLPLVWHFAVERGRLSRSPLARQVRARALGEGLLLGAAFAGVVLAANALVGEQWLDPEMLRDVLTRAGLTTPARYFAMALYIALANSLLEEYVWRWFAFRQVERLVGPRLAVPLAASFFTLHHVLVFAVQLGTQLAIAGSIAVFVAGCLWSWLYARWRSIWPGWLCHALVDGAGFTVGAAVNDVRDGVDDPELNEPKEGDQSLILGAQWARGDWYLAANYNRSEEHETDDEGTFFDAEGAELYASLALDARHKAYAGFNWLEPDDSDYGGDFERRYIAAGISRAFGLERSRSVVFLECALEDSQDADGSDGRDSVFGGGMRLNF